MTRPARVTASALLVALLVTALTACAPESSRVTTAVGSDGFRVEVGGVTVTAPAGVAPSGTSVVVEVVDAALPSDVTAFASAEGTGVSIVLDGGDLQPSEPLQVTFDVQKGAGGADLFVVGEDPSAGTGVSFVESAWDARESTITATVEHLSWYAPVRVDGEKLSDKIRAWLDESLGVQSAKPSCPQSTTLRFSDVRDDVVWPCAAESSRGVDWSLHSNSGLVWEVLTDPKAIYDPLTATSIAGIATIEAVNLIGSALEGDTVVVPLETLSGRFDEAAPYTIALQVEPGLSQIATVMFGLSMILPKGWVERASKGECLVDIVKAATSSPSGETIRTILGCVGEFLGGTAGALMGIVLKAPGLLATQLQGLVREITQTNTVQFTLGRVDPNQVEALPSGATWLSEIPQEITSRSSEAVVAVVPVGDDDLEFAHSSSVWVGCDGATDTAIFYVDGDYTELNFGLGLQEHTPVGLSAEFVVSVVSVEDSRLIPPQSSATEVARWTVERGTILERQSIPLDGVWSVSISATSQGECGSADIGYGALLDAYVM